MGGNRLGGRSWVVLESCGLLTQAGMEFLGVWFLGERGGVWYEERF
jgi:hypothetical protein